ncbi:CLUMA_CG014681, isoform A [Clunio marinus]|uniref:CLUMA_CG014681, isoform A n=1 Tax=Clunio marinus TaxID=568069 RepID=A0A1J1IMI8_9DIPT|nr:CLUMA_CG014681, isoform A [Clunio marinus]
MKISFNSSIEQEKKNLYFGATTENTKEKHGNHIEMKKKESRYVAEHVTIYKRKTKTMPYYLLQDSIILNY